MPWIAPKPVLLGDSEDEIRRATVIGGIAGLWAGAVVIVLSANHFQGDRMTERRAHILIFAGMGIVTTAAMLGLSALRAGGSILFLGVIVPLVVGAYLSSSVVVRYGPSGRRRRERR